MKIINTKDGDVIGVLSSVKVGDIVLITEDKDGSVAVARLTQLEAVELATTILNKSRE